MILSSVFFIINLIIIIIIYTIINKFKTIQLTGMTETLGRTSEWSTRWTRKPRRGRLLASGTSTTLISLYARYLLQMQTKNKQLKMCNWTHNATGQIHTERGTVSGSRCQTSTGSHSSGDHLKCELFPKLDFCLRILIISIYIYVSDDWELYCGPWNQLLVRPMREVRYTLPQSHSLKSNFD